MGYFPTTLLHVNHSKSIDQSISPEKKSLEGNIPDNHISVTAEREHNRHKWLSTDEEKEFVENLITNVLTSPRLNFLTQLQEFLVTVAEQLQNRLWPKELCDIYLKCYVRWRGHTEFPDEFGPQDPHRFIPVVIIANEILLQTKLNECSNVRIILKL